MNGYQDGLYQVSTRKATYGIEVRGGRVVKTAPIAVRYMGWVAAKAFADLRIKWGAHVIWIDTPQAG